MGYVISIALVLLVGALVTGLVIAYRRLPRLYFVLLITLLIGGPFTAFKLYERRFMLEDVPDALKVDSISYRKEESCGFGPGGNEAGIRQYPLSNEISQLIERRGVEFLNNLPPNQNQTDRDWRGAYEGWEETPIKPSQHWKPDGKAGNFDIYDYICAYGFCIDIEPTVVEATNSIVNTPGSYYAYGRLGLIIVSPRNNLVVYLHNG